MTQALQSLYYVEITRGKSGLILKPQYVQGTIIIMETDLIIPIIVSLMNWEELPYDNDVLILGMKTFLTNISFTFNGKFHNRGPSIKFLKYYSRTKINNKSIAIPFNKIYETEENTGVRLSLEV